LHAAGWNSLFVNEVLAYGIAPQTIHAFLTQRLRWAQGTMQLYRSKDSPLWKPGLSFAQRASYFTSFRAYIEAVQKLILLLTPSVIILSHVLPMRVSAAEFLIHWIPYFIITLIASRLAGRGYFAYLQNEKFSMLKMVIFLQSFLALIPFRLTFKVTPKSIDDSVYRMERADMRIYMILFGVILGVTFASIPLLDEAQNAGVQPFFLLIAVIWSIYNASIIFLALRDVLTRKHFQHMHRFLFDAAGELVVGTRTVPVELKDVSTTGLSFTLDAREDLPPEGVSLRITTANNNQVALPLSRIFKRSSWGGQTLMAAEFAALDHTQRKQLLELLYIAMPGTFYDRGYTPASAA
jgi:cellulose synthase (UDP-forming)